MSENPADPDFWHSRWQENRIGFHQAQANALLRAHLGALDQHMNLRRYSAENIDIFTGDVFDLTTNILGSVDAIYDRAALVALPRDTRPRYGAHLARITGTAPQFLICFEYDQSLMDGPPFSTDASEVARIYGQTYTLTDHAAKEVEGGLKGKIPATERVWLLR